MKKESKDIWIILGLILLIVFISIFLFTGYFNNFFSGKEKRNFKGELGSVNPLGSSSNQGLVAYYPLDVNANDLSGNGNNGAWSGIQSYSAGKIGQAASFNGVDNYINISNNPILDGYPQMTISFWAKYPEPIINYPTFLSKGFGSYYSTLLGPIYNENKSKIVFMWFNQTNRTDLYSVSKPSFNTWHYFTSVYNSVSGIAYLYIDGNLDNSISVSGNIRATPYDLYIGTDLNRQTNVMFNGTIDEVKIWNYALNDIEIKNEYQKKGNLVAYYPFDLNANDLSGNGNNGVVNGALFTSGKIGQGYYFNNTSFISILNPLGLSNSPFTISEWIKTDVTNGQAYNIFNTGSGSGYRFGIGSGKVAFLIGNITSYRETECGTNIVNDNKWHHIVGVFDRGNSFKCYIDGGLNGTIPIAYYNNISDSAPTIGPYPGPGYPTNFNGSIDNIKIWNYALNSTEIMDEYNCSYNCSGSTHICNSNGQCVQCLSDNDCNSGFICNSNGQCITKSNDNNGGNNETGYNINTGNSTIKPLVLFPIGNKDTIVKQLLEFTISAYDPNGNNLTYNSTDLPNGAKLDSKTGKFNWIPNENQAGDYNIIFSVTNGKLISSEFITIKVLPIENPITDIQKSKEILENKFGLYGTIIFWIIVAILLIAFILVAIYLGKNIINRMKNK